VGGGGCNEARASLPGSSAGGRAAARRARGPGQARLGGAGSGRTHAARGGLRVAGALYVCEAERCRGHHGRDRGRGLGCDDRAAAQRISEVARVAELELRHALEKDAVVDGLFTGGNGDTNQSGNCQIYEEEKWSKL
jgi:hypothetical protein